MNALGVFELGNPNFFGVCGEPKLATTVLYVNAAPSNTPVFDKLDDCVLLRMGSWESHSAGP